MVARLTPDQKAACSNHVGVKLFLAEKQIKQPALCTINDLLWWKLSKKIIFNIKWPIFTSTYVFVFNRWKSFGITKTVLIYSCNLNTYKNWNKITIKVTYSSCAPQCYPDSCFWYSFRTSLIRKKWICIHFCPLL